MVKYVYQIDMMARSVTHTMLMNGMVNTMYHSDQLELLDWACIAAVWELRMSWLIISGRGPQRHCPFAVLPCHARAL